MNPQQRAQPLMALALFIAWLLLNNSVSVGNLLMGGIFALGISFFLARWRGSERPTIGRWGEVVRLGCVVLYDIVVSNITVARQVLGPEARLNSQFVWVPLTLRDPHGIAALAGIITMTPGTLSSDLTESRSHLLVHALHVDDADELIAAIKTRYEAPLMRIFEGTA